MRIALVITELDPGGAEKCLTQLACYLAKHEHEVRVFAIGPPPPCGLDQLVRELEARRIPVAMCFPTGQRRSLRSFAKVVRWLRFQLKEFDPQLVQAMLFHGNLAAALAVDAKRVPLFGGVRVRQPERWRWWVERWYARRMRKVVCVSDDVRLHCQQQEKIPPDKLVTIPNGIDLAAVARLLELAPTGAWSQFGLPPAARVLLFVGRLHPQKGVEELVTRADALLRTLPAHHLVLMGNGPLDSRLQALAAQQQTAARVHVVGWHSNALQWMQRAEMLLLPAAYEGMPNVVLEAMAVGLPFVAFDIDGVRQILAASPSATHQIAARADFENFIELTQRLALNTEVRAACSLSNLQIIQRNFQLDQRLAEYLGLFVNHSNEDPGAKRLPRLVK